MKIAESIRLQSCSPVLERLRKEDGADVIGVFFKSIRLGTRGRRIEP